MREEGGRVRETDIEREEGERKGGRVRETDKEGGGREEGREI